MQEKDSDLIILIDMRRLPAAGIKPMVGSLLYIIVPLPNSESPFRIANIDGVLCLRPANTGSVSITMFDLFSK